MDERNGFYQPESPFSLAGIKLFFKNWISPMVSTSRKKYPNKRILFQVDRNSVSTNRNSRKSTLK